eukprot:CAMPEP_0119147570 /NCGR_PEP_ID=MMETSP1310-20130426/40552_1 /TAXON_ID=464262 /ORGANISM="Genus nov. species nov., Strain RCC2339" /LENGTH=58 /DNA_ID=CAMNT_0007139543 /DNA_START=31 /DNA_END=203 /DNA_ORIENTATION=-
MARDSSSSDTLMSSIAKSTPAGGGRRRSSPSDTVLGGPRVPGELGVATLGPPAPSRTG